MSLHCIIPIVCLGYVILFVLLSSSICLLTCLTYVHFLTLFTRISYVTFSLLQSLSPPFSHTMHPEVLYLYLYGVRRPHPKFWHIIGHSSLHFRCTVGLDFCNTLCNVCPLLSITFILIFDLLIFNDFLILFSSDLGVAGMDTTVSFPSFLYHFSLFCIFSFFLSFILHCLFL